LIINFFALLFHGMANLILIRKINMRHLLFFILILLISCSEKTDKNGLGYFSNLQFSIDTVVIDPGDDIIFLENKLLDADKSIDDKYLLNFNMNDFTLEKISLDRLRLEEKLPFEKEGPNGTGTSIGSIKFHNDSQMIISNMNQSRLFSLEGKKLMTINFENFSLGWEDGELVSSRPVLDTDANRLYVLIDRIEDRDSFLGILHLDKYEISRIELQTFEKLPDYRFTLWMGKSSVGFGPGMGIEKFGSKVILSNQTTSSLMWCDTELDSLNMKSYSSQLTASEKVNSYKLEHETEESIEAEYTRFHQEINFLAPFWDEKNQVFYRFSYQELPSESKDEGHIKSKIYLTVLDKGLNLIGEAFIPQLKKTPETPFSKPFPKHFAKDGKIWIYENINDEMGFIVLTISD